MTKGPAVAVRLADESLVQCPGQQGCALTANGLVSDVHAVVVQHLYQPARDIQKANPHQFTGGSCTCGTAMLSFVKMARNEPS